MQDEQDDSEEDLQRKRPYANRDERMEALARVRELWSILDSPPTARSELICTTRCSDLELVYLRRGRDFARLASEIGINPATKKARVIARNRSKSHFSAARTTFDEEINLRNQAIIELRLQRHQ